MRFARAASIALILLVVLAPICRAEEEERPEPGVTVERGKSGRVVRAILPGRLISYALPRRQDGGRDVVLLVVPHREPEPEPEPDPPEPPPDPCREREQSPPPPPEPRHLLCLETGGAGEIVTLGLDLPPDAAGIDAADVDGDGVEEVLLVRPGELSQVWSPGEGAGASERRVLVTDPHIRGGHLDPVLLRFPGLAAAGYYPVPALGGLRIYGVSSETRIWGLRTEVSLTLDSRIRGGTLRISSPLVQPVGRGAGGTLYLAAGPRRHAGRRLLTVLINPLAEAGDRTVPVWSRLPSPERVLEAFYSILDGRPVLIVTTRSAEKLSFFEEKMLRIFPLEGGDRSKVGAPPLLALESNANLWQAIVPVIRDLNGDGLEDLVLAYWKGLKDDTLVLDAYLRKSDGSFDRSPATTRFDVEGADRGALGFGRDLNGDGRPELVIDAAGLTQIHGGELPRRNGRGLVEETPRWTFPGGSGRWQAEVSRSVEIGGGGGITADLDTFGPVRLADIDGDGTPELLGLRTSQDGLGRFQVIRIQ